MDKQKMMAIVSKMCAYQSTSCRGLDMADMARGLLDIASVPASAVVSEIPVSDDNQVIIYFYVPNDDNYYMLFAGDGCDGSKSNFKLYIDGKNPCTDDFYFLDKDIEIDIDYFKEDTNMANKTLNSMIKQAVEITFSWEINRDGFNWIYQYQVENARDSILYGINRMIDCGMLLEDEYTYAESIVDKQIAAFLKSEHVAVVDDNSEDESELTYTVGNELLGIEEVVREARTKEDIRDARNLVNDAWEHLRHTIPAGWMDSVKHRLDENMGELKFKLDFMEVA